MGWHAVLLSSDARALPLWGAPGIQGALLKRGINVSQATVAKYIGRPHQAQSQTWRTFLRNHIGQIVAADFLVVPTATCRLLFVLVIWRMSVGASCTSVSPTIRPRRGRRNSSARRSRGTMRHAISSVIAIQ